MKICIPTNEDNGLASTVCGHFGSAPWYLIVDSETGACRPIANANQHHDHGMCRPLDTLRGERIDAMVVGGIGRGALSKLAAAGVEVYLASAATVAKTLDAWKAETLERMQPGMACAGHGQDPGHGHDHGHDCGHR